MTILQALDRYYDRIPDVAAPGWSSEKFGWCIILGPDGALVDVQNLHDLDGKKPKVRLYPVPEAVSRTSGVKPNFLWDKTAYVLGVKKRPREDGENNEDKPPWEAAEREHAAFRDLHLERLAGEADEGLRALCGFLEQWQPEQFDANPRLQPEMLDANFMFRLDGDRCFLHERPAAKALVERFRVADNTDRETAFCLIRGEAAPITRLHPSIGGVQGAQSSGASLVSFNQDSFESYGQKQGANAPTSEAAAFRYGTALNHLLRRDSHNRLARPVGDATIVFWADASEVRASTAAEDFFSMAVDPDQIERETARKLMDELEAVAKGRPLSDLNPDIEPGTRFHVLGLSPNAARLSVRFWLSGTLDQFAKRLAEHYQDLRIEPAPMGWGHAPSVNRLLVNTTALLRDYKNIPPLLAGEVMRATLSGSRYPQSLLAAAIIRLRAGDNAASGWHAAVIRAIIARDHRSGFQKEGISVSLNPEESSQAYQLGRLFAVLEAAQRMALGKTNTTIRDRYFGAASATPASVFPLLLRGVQNHLGKLRKSGKGGWIEREIEDILDHLGAALPRSLPLAEQGRFAVGYYHQRSSQFKGRPDAAAELDEAEAQEEEPAE